MSRKFTVVVYDDESLFMSGYVDKEEVAEIEELQEYVENTSAYSKIDISILHYQYLDFEDAPVEDATDEELDILIDCWDDLVAENALYFDGGFEFSIYGLHEEQLIDTLE